MGVIYKLKPSVVSFIVDEKRKNPSLSCRRLADIVNETFSLDVSKSSVNSVIKEADLSNSVGRPRSPRRKRNRFKIPQEKKESLFQEVPNLGLSPAAECTSPDKPFPEKIKKEAEQRIAPIQEEQEKPLTPDPKPVPVLAPKPASEIIEKVSAAVSDGKSLPEAGYVFLKAASQEVLNNSSLLELLNGTTGNIFSSKQTNILNALFMCRMAGATTKEDVQARAQKGFWELNECVLNEEIEALLQIMQAKQLSSSDISEYQKQVEQLWLYAGAFKITLEDKSEILIDTKFASVWSSGIPSPFSSVINTALDNLSNYLIGNVAAPVFSARVQNGIDFNGFGTLVAALENQSGKKIIKTSVLSNEGFEIAAFTTIPQKRRQFILGIDDRASYFAQGAPTLSGQSKETYHQQALAKDFQIAQSQAEVNWPQTRASLKHIGIYEGEKSQPSWILLTNMADADPKELADAFLLKFYHLDTQIQAGKEAENSQNLQEITDFWSILADFGGKIQNYAKNHYFLPDITTNQLLSDIYALEGRIWRDAKTVCVELNAPSDPVTLKALKQAIGAVNLACVHDSKGRRLILRPKT